MKVFSFCLYGKNIKYYRGFNENVKIINTYFPDFHIYLYLGKEHLEIKKSEKIHIIQTNKSGVANMIYRYLPMIDPNVSIIFSRDADSEINERDRWCINQFINSDYKAHTIRDHYWHKRYFSGGLSGFKTDFSSDILSKLKDILSIEKDDYKYGDDEIFISKHFYDLFKDKLLIHTNINAYKNEIHKTIDMPLTEYNFCGNVIEYDKGKYYKFKYTDFNILEQLNWLDNQKKYKLMIKIFEDYKDIPYNEQVLVYDKIYCAYYYSDNLKGCMDIYKKYCNHTITTHIKNNSKHIYNLARRHKYKIVGTCDTSYTSNNEIVIYYGSYPDDYMSLPQSKKIYQNVLEINTIQLDSFIHHSCWDNIDKIYIIGLENAEDRYFNTLYQLSLMNAPLNKVFWYRAKVDKDKNKKYLGATKNHLDCIQDMYENKYENCLFIEDDFMFISDLNECKKSLLSFFERKYDFNICFLASSKYHRREEYDDLLLVSKQECTTSSSYILNKNNVKNVLNIVKEGYNLLEKNLDKHYIYCIDRYWNKLNKLFIFKRKLGYQRPLMSKITNQLNKTLD